MERNARASPGDIGRLDKKFNDVITPLADKLDAAIGAIQHLAGMQDSKVVGAV